MRPKPRDYLILFLHVVAGIVPGLITSPALAEPATVARVIDADTVVVDLAGKRTTVRLHGIDAPESKLCPPNADRTNGCAKCPREAQLGQQAKAEAARMMPAGSVVDVRPTGKREKWGRLLAEIKLPNGDDYGRIMLAKGLAFQYNGKTKKSWCQ